MSRTFSLSLAFGLLLLGKWWHQGATAADLSFLLVPTDALVGLVIDSGSVWRAGEGFFLPAHNVLIDASCAGFNFFLIAFLAFAYLLPSRWSGWSVLPLALLLAWPVTVLANASRIVSLLVVGTFAPAWTHSSFGHEFQGAFVYFFFLITFYLLARYFLSPAKSLSL